MIALIWVGPFLFHFYKCPNVRRPSAPLSCQALCAPISRQIYAARKKPPQKKKRNTLRRQIKNVNIIVCVIVESRSIGLRVWKDVFELGAKKVNNDICHCFALECWICALSCSTFPFLSLILDSFLEKVRLQRAPAPLSKNMPQGMNTLSQLIASAGNNLETALLFCSFRAVLPLSKLLLLFFVVGQFRFTHNITHTQFHFYFVRSCCCCCALRRLRKTF